MNDLLQRIQSMQFQQKSEAEALLLSFLHEVYAPDVESVELRPLAVSLNSFNGFLTRADGTRLFFKTHTEPDGVIGEYYHAAQLAAAGYPVIQPVYSSTQSGKQLLIYPLIERPSVFDVAWQIESHHSDTLDVLTTAQNTADDLLFALYERSLQSQTDVEAAQAPIHQLFYHRLTGGRLDRFYGSNSNLQLPGINLPLSEVRQVTWEINGQQYDESLESLIHRSTDLLAPMQAGSSIVGHGDAHNGNVFFRGSESLLYFDPAFAGRHHPLLDLTKPLFHNVFAMWMYYPREKRSELNIQLRRDGTRWIVQHDYKLHPVREMFLRSKVDRVLIPTLRMLKAANQLRQDWRSYLKAALFCCPFLTMNLSDSERFPPEISLLGLTMAIEMGFESAGERSLIDRTLDEAESAI
jgi:hypothetical protein